jgi:hypothetical protein
MVLISLQLVKEAEPNFYKFLLAACQNVCMFVARLEKSGCFLKI